MRQSFIIIILLFCLQGYSQEGFLKTKSVDLAGIQEIEIGIRANVYIDCEGKEGLKIKANESLVDRVGVHLVNGRLYLRPNDPIEEGAEIEISIGAPNLNFVQANHHAEVEVVGVNQEEISAMALSGTISLKGKTERLNANGEIGIVDARELLARTVQLNFWGGGEAKLGSPEKVIGKTSKNTRLSYQNEPEKNLKAYSKRSTRSSTVNSKSSSKVRNPEARFIKFDIKNNSLNRIQCYVKGPKPDGSTFSYGFPMNPGQKRNKYWSVGSKVYRVNHMGMKKLLLEIKAEDEGQVVKMYAKN